MRELHQNRRDFIRRALAAGTALSVWPDIQPIQAAPKKSPNEKLNLASIGTAARAASNLKGCKSENIVALCDIDAIRLDEASKKYPGADLYEDYRRVLDRNDLDGVIVSTPDHFHAVATAAALRKGLPVYCEKPLTHSVYEARVIRELAKKAGVATQMGNQIHSGSNYRRVVELIEKGVIGTVERVHVWVGSGGRDIKGALAETHNPPAYVNYDQWLGPAPFRNFHESHFHFNWRYWWDFGNGQLGDFGCHYIDLPFWALDLDRPTSIHAKGEKDHDGPNECPKTLTVDYQFPAKGSRPAVHLTWYHGNAVPEWAEQYKKRSAVLFEGSEGKLLADYGTKQLFFDGDEKAAVPPYIPDSPGHHQEWINAINNGTPTGSNFAYATDLTETVLLGNVSYRAGQVELKYDAESGKVTNNVSEAANYLQREYRKGWVL